MIDQATLQAATTKLLLDSMSPEDREKLLSTALTNVLTPVKSGSWPNSREESPLQSAFNTAARLEAEKQVKEYFQRPDVQERLKTQIALAVEKAFSDDFVESLTKRMVAGMWSER